MTDAFFSKKLEDATILIVDDQVINLEVLDMHLSTHFKIVRALSGTEAIDICQVEVPDLIIMDVIMPGLDGLETCARLRKREEFADIPVIFSTSLSTAKDETACWDAGGTDFIAKPVHPETLKRRIHYHIKLKLQTDLLKHQVYRDPLTNIYNRKYLEEHGDKLVKQANRTGRPLVLLMIDIDCFKLYNDLYGHVKGDDCLKVVASTLNNLVARPSDIVVRYGGEEFCCMLPETDEQGARKIARNMCTTIESLNICHPSSPQKRITVSIGGVVTCGLQKTVEDLIKDADLQLYRQKLKGKNGVSF